MSRFAIARSTLSFLAALVLELAVGGSPAPAQGGAPPRRYIA
jgi:hypothetical protein